MTIYMIFVFVVAAIWSGLLYYFTEEGPLTLYGLFGSTFLLFFFRGYVYFALNSYDYFEDVEKLNKKIDKHNINIEFMENKKVEVQ